MRTSTPCSKCGQQRLEIVRVVTDDKDPRLICNLVRCQDCGEEQTDPNSLRVGEPLPH